MPIASAELLRQHGLRVTAQRLAVLRVVADEPHATADAVAAAVRDDVGAVSLQAVYDALGALVDAGLVRRIQPAGSAARFEARASDNHHHLICRTCGRVVDVDCAVGHAPCLSAADDRGFEIDEAEVVYWGRCPECTAADRGARNGTTTESTRNESTNNKSTNTKSTNTESREKTPRRKARQESERRV